MRAVLKILAVLYLVCVVFKTRTHYTILGLEERARQLELRLEKDLKDAETSLSAKIKNLKA
jgi:Ca2+/H+ antiporter